MTWTEINCFIRPSQRSWTALTVVNDVLFIYGGLDSHDTSLEDLWRCDGRNWNRIYYQKSPFLASSMVDYGRVWHTAFYNSSDGQLTIVGGDKQETFTGTDENQWRESKNDLINLRVSPPTLLHSAHHCAKIDFLNHLNPAWIDSRESEAELGFIKRQFELRSRVENTLPSHLYLTAMIWRKESEIISLDVNAFISLYLRARQLPEMLQDDPKIRELLLEADEKQFISLIPIV